jgi:hypothetical protein
LAQNCSGSGLLKLLKYSMNRSGRVRGGNAIGKSVAAKQPRKEQGNQPTVGHVCFPTAKVPATKSMYDFPEGKRPGVRLKAAK